MSTGITARYNLESYQENFRIEDEDNTDYSIVSEYEKYTYLAITLIGAAILTTAFCICPPLGFVATMALSPSILLWTVIGLLIFCGIEEDEEEEIFELPPYLGEGLHPQSKINPQHLQATMDLENRIPEAPANVRLEELRGFFRLPRHLSDKKTHYINFIDPSRPDYFDPTSIQDDTTPISAREAFRNINTWIKNIDENRMVLGVPKNPVARKIYYQKIKKLLLHIIHEYKQIETDLVCKDPSPLNEADRNKQLKQIKTINTRNTVLCNIATAMGHCGGRVLGEALKGYQNAKGLKVDGLKEIILSKLHDTRSAIVDEIASEYHPEVESLFQSHVPLAYLRYLSPSRGIMGEEAVNNFVDPFRGAGIQLSVSKEQALKRFDAKYTRKGITDIVYDLFNGIPHREKKCGIEITIRDREVELDEITKWFKENVPVDWQHRTVKEDYQDAADQYWHEDVLDVKWQNNDPNSGIPLDMTIKKTAVIYFLKKTGVITA